MNFTDIMGKAGGAAGGIAGIVNTAVEAAQIKDTTKEWNLINNIKSTMVDLDSYDLLELLWNNTSFANTGYKQKDVRGLTGWQQAGKVLSATGLGAATGASFGPWGALAGAVAGLGAGIGGALAGNAKAAKEANRLNYEGMLANQSFMKNFENNNKNIAMNNKNQALLNVAAFGGPLYANPFSNGVRFIEKGGSHEENPLGGVPQGMAPDGLPNLVEEGEVIFNDYVYSKRLKVPKKDYAMLGLKGKKEYTYADAATEIQKESEERPNDPLSKRNLESMFARLQTSQDELKEKRDAQKMKREFDKMSPEELTYMLQAMQGEQQAPSQEIPVQQLPMMAAYGGHLFEYGGTPFVYTSTDNIADGPREVYFYNPGYINGDTDLDFPYNILAYDPFVQNGLDVLLELANTNHNNETTTSQNVLNKRELPPLNFNPFGYKFSNPNYKSPSLDLTFEPADKTIVNDPLGYGYRFLDPSYKSPVTDFEIQKAPASTPKEDDESVESDDTDAAAPPLKEGFSSNLLLRAMPIVGNLASAFTSIFDKPNYDNLEKAEQMFRQIPNIGPKPVSDMMLYNPTDINYLSTQLGNQLARARRTVMENSGGNSAAAMLNLLSTNYKGQEALSEAFRQGMEYNDNKYNTVVDFNRGTNTFNSEQALQSAAQNQLMAYNKALQSLNIANLKNQELAATQKVKSDSLSNLFTSLGNYGKDKFARDQVKALVETGAYNKQSEPMLDLLFNYMAYGGELNSFAHSFENGGDKGYDPWGHRRTKKDLTKWLRGLKKKAIAEAREVVKDYRARLKEKVNTPRWVKEILKEDTGIKKEREGQSTVRWIDGRFYPDSEHASYDQETIIELKPREYKFNKKGDKVIVEGKLYTVNTDEFGNKYFLMETNEKDLFRGFGSPGWLPNLNVHGVEKKAAEILNPYNKLEYPHITYKFIIEEPSDDITTDEPELPTDPEDPTDTKDTKSPRETTQINGDPRFNPFVSAPISALSSLIDTPSYANTEAAEDMIAKVPKIKAVPVGEKQIYNPIDINKGMILGINQYNAALRQAVEGNQGNGSIDVSSLGIDPVAIMSEYYNANNYNFSKKNKVNTFNRDTNKFNSKQKLKADTYNQKMNDELAKLFLQAALYKDAELAAFQENRNALLTNIFNNIKNYGKDRLTQDQVMALVSTGAYGAMSDIMNPKKKGDKNA